jgi:pyruvyltransferase
MNYINLTWWGTNGNWGDELNPFLVNKISGREIKRIENNSDDFRYYCIGSILQTINSSNFEIWGTGFIDSGSKLKFKPNKIHSVRGPLTRKLLIEQGFDCPEVYGDPALLYPLFYRPENINKKYKYGIIPHYIDRENEWVKKVEAQSDVKVINILDKSINKFIDEIHECDFLLSSSLHGIIAGDSYGIPSYWIEISNKVQGKGFKFKDYLESVERNIEPIVIKYEDKLEDISKNFYEYKIKIDLKKLYESCPFK